jgi:hypothetical protein
MFQYNAKKHIELIITSARNIRDMSVSGGIRTKSFRVRLQESTDKYSRPGFELEIRTGEQIKIMSCFTL